MVGISLGAAALGSAIIGGGAAVLGASKNSKAINKASAAQEEATAQNTALQREIYGKNASALAPFMQRGNAAGGAINALLGLGAGAAGNAGYAPEAFAEPEMVGPSAESALSFILPEIGPKRTRKFNKWLAANPGASADDQLAFIRGVAHNDEASMLAQYQAQLRPAPMQPAVPQQQVPPAQKISPQQSALDAYNIFKQSTGYQTRLQEGFNGINAGYAGRGLVQSGAAQKALLDYGQQQASGEFRNYLGYLGNQQGVGLSGASALAGVGQDYANSIQGLNQTQADFAGNAAGARAANTNAALGTVAGSLSGALNTFGGSSYGGIPSFNGYGTPITPPQRYPGYGLVQGWA